MPLSEDDRKQIIRDIIDAGSSFTIVGIEDQVDKISLEWERDLKEKE